jgi:hypothetical protein
MRRHSAAPAADLIAFLRRPPDELRDRQPRRPLEELLPSAGGFGRAEVLDAIDRVIGERLMRLDDALLEM